MAMRLAKGAGLLRTLSCGAGGQVVFEDAAASIAGGGAGHVDKSATADVDDTAEHCVRLRTRPVNVFGLMRLRHERGCHASGSHPHTHTSRHSHLHLCRQYQQRSARVLICVLHDRVKHQVRFTSAHAHAASACNAVHVVCMLHS
jgi:hypothetical protein